ncbi:hypothetical protein [Acerihabitans sp. TG2]|uniref:hypothetical protein n=1 Tax=Acerihabitans sp. TG2 TaxID=3096008 RepID=UPI003A59925F
MDNEILKEAVEYGREKNGLRIALVTRGRRLTLVSQSLGVSRAQLSVLVHRKPAWQDGRRNRPTDDGELVMRIQQAVADVPTYGYRRY